jgi:hypothetical protein
LELNGTLKLLVYTDDVIVLEENLNIIDKNTKILTEASREVGVEINSEKKLSNAVNVR